MTSRLSTKLFAVARIIGRRAMAALSKNGKEVNNNWMDQETSVLSLNRVDRL